MAETTITQLISAAPVSGSELIEVVQVGESFKIDLATLRDWIATFVQTQLTLTAEWELDTNTTAADPGSGKFRLDTVTPQVSAANIYIDDNNKQAMYFGLIFGTLSLGDLVFIQQKADSTRALLFEVSGAATDNTGWWTIHVKNGEASANDIANKTTCSLIFHTSG